MRVCSAIRVVRVVHGDTSKMKLNSRRATDILIITPIFWKPKVFCKKQNPERDELALNIESVQKLQPLRLGRRTIKI